MAINFDVFAVKYPEFAQERLRFEAFLPDVETEIASYDSRWGTKRDIASEMLMGHKLSFSLGSASSSSSAGGSTPVGLKKIEVEDDRYSVEYHSPESNSFDLKSTKYGQEYLRLLESILSLSPESQANNPYSGTFWVGKRGENHLNW